MLRLKLFRERFRPRNSLVVVGLYAVLPHEPNTLNSYWTNQTKVLEDDRYAFPLGN